MNHIVLAGDSIFDNAAYVVQNQAVIELLTQKVHGDSNATLLAVDGAVTEEVHDQLDKLPTDSTHLFISSGGNDALESAHLLAEPVTSVFEAMGVFSEVINTFQAQYKNMLDDAISRVDNVIVCTVYDSIPGYEREPLTALKLFNEVILREAFSQGLPVIDLRLICNDPADYSSVSPIEPSEQGGDKITDAILKVAQQHDFIDGGSVVWSEL